MGRTRVDFRLKILTNRRKVDGRFLTSASTTPLPLGSEESEEAEVIIRRSLAKASISEAEMEEEVEEAAEEEEEAVEEQEQQRRRPIKANPTCWKPVIGMDLFFRCSI